MSKEAMDHHRHAAEHHEHAAKHHLAPMPAITHSR